MYTCTLISSELHNENYGAIFTARRYDKRGICFRCVSMCLSVTLRYCIKTAKRRITQIAPRDSP